VAAKNSPEWWADRLIAKLSKRKPNLERLERYYDGRVPLAYATSRFRQEFGTMLAAINDNWCQVPIGAVDERLNLDSFRVGTDEDATKRALEIWAENAMELDAQIAHTEALKLGECHAIVWPSSVQGAAPVITIESPEHVIVELDPENRSKRLAAVKAWRDEELGQCATVYLPDGIYKLRRGRKGWEPRQIEGEEYPVENPWKVVPVVPVANRPGLSDDSVSDIENILSKQDMVNKLWADMIIAAEYSAFRQRWATGVDIPKESGTDATDQDFMAAVDRLWSTAAADAKFGEFDQTDLSVYVGAIEKLVQHIASQTATPQHYFVSTEQPPSAESLRAAEAPLVAKVRRKQRIFGAAWAEIMRLALEMDKVTYTGRVSVVWADPETRTESEHIDAVTKMKSLDLPTEMLWEMAGLSTADITRAKAMRALDAVTAAMSAPGVGSSASPMQPADTPEEIRAMADAMGVLIRAGASPESAAARVGLSGLTFTGAIPTSLRPPADQATQLEQV